MCPTCTVCYNSLLAVLWNATVSLRTACAEHCSVRAEVAYLTVQQLQQPYTYHLHKQFYNRTFCLSCKWLALSAATHHTRFMLALAFITGCTNLLWVRRLLQ